MPGIATGIFGYPKAEGCRVLVEEVSRHLRSGAGTVRLVSIDDETASHFLAAATEVW